MIIETTAVNETNELKDFKDNPTNKKKRLLPESESASSYDTNESFIEDDDTENHMEEDLSSSKLNDTDSKVSNQRVTEENSNKEHNLN